MESSTEHVQMKASPAEQILKFLLQDEQATLPPPSESQLQESDDCGFWVLALLRNEGPRSRGQQQICVMDMKSLLATWLKILKTEQMKSQSGIEKRLKKLNLSRPLCRRRQRPWPSLWLRQQQQHLKLPSWQIWSTTRKRCQNCRICHFPVSRPLTRSKLLVIQASVPGAGMVLAVSPAQWPKLKDTI